MTHKAKAPDALDAKARNLSDGGKNTTPMRDGWYINANGLRIEQPMQHPATGVCKGLRTILQERNLHLDHGGHLLPKICHPCQSGMSMAERLDEAGQDTFGRNGKCCSLYVLPLSTARLLRTETLANRMCGGKGLPNNVLS